MTSTADMDGTTQPMARLVKDLRARAEAAGFDAFGITHPDAVPEAGERLRDFVAAGFHGDMAWMEDTIERRAHPRQLMADARSIIMLGASYVPPADPLDALADKSRGVISVYAKGRDYHDVLKGRLKQIAGLLATRANADVKVFVDTAPLMEKPFAMAAGLGWQGKHTNLVSRSHGSWLFLGSILTNVVLPQDQAESDHCGRCRSCLDVCPTNAFPAPYKLDARRCIAYLTIEHEGHIAREFREPMGNRIFGCDDCLAVCPWNKFAEASREAKFAAREATDNPPIAELLELDEAAFRARFAGTPIKRTGRDRFIRNVLIAAGNSGQTDAINAVVSLLDDGSPLVRAMAVWALSRLCVREKFLQLRAMWLGHETDVDVQNEWMEGGGDGTL